MVNYSQIRDKAGANLDDRIREAPLFTDFSLDSLFSSIGNDPLINSMKDDDIYDMLSVYGNTP